MRKLGRVLGVLALCSFAAAGAAFAGTITKTFEFGPGTPYTRSNVRTFPVPCRKAVAVTVKFQTLGTAGADHVENSSMLNGRGGPSWRNYTATVPQPGVLEAEFRINGGAASTLERIVTLNFQVRRRIGQETRSTVATHYRAVESRNLLNADLSGQPWIALKGQIKASLTLQLSNG